MSTTKPAVCDPPLTPSFFLFSHSLFSFSFHTAGARAQLEEILRELHITQLDEGFDEIYTDEIAKGELPLEDIKQLIAMQFPPGAAAAETDAPTQEAAPAAPAAADEGFPDLPDVPGTTGAGAEEDIDEAAFEEIPKRLAGMQIGSGGSPGADAGAGAGTAPGAGADAAPDYEHMTEESFDALFPSTPAAKGPARPAVSAGGSVFPAAPTSSTHSSSSSSNVFPAAPTTAASSRDPFPASPSSSSHGSSDVFPAAPTSSNKSVFPAAPQQPPQPQQQHVFPAAPQPQPQQQAPASVFPAAPGSAGARGTDAATAAAQVNQLFEHYYPGQVPPAETVAYYVRQVAGGAMTIAQVQDEIRAALERYRCATQGQTQAAASPAKTTTTAAASRTASSSPSKAAAAAPARPRYTLEDDGTPMTKEVAQGFVDWLYVRYCGGANRGDVARKPQLVRELVSGNYSKKMACWTVQRSKEAIRYAEVKKTKRAKLTDYIAKAARIVCPKHLPSQAEVAALVEQVLDQEKTLDEVEAELAARA